RLSGASVANQGESPAWLDFKAHSFENPLRRRGLAAIAGNVAYIIREPHVSKLDGNAPRADEGPGSIGLRLGIDYRRRLGDGRVEEAEHTFTRRHRLLERVELVGEILERLEEATDQ